MVKFVKYSLLFLSIFLLFNCSGDDDNPKFPFERTILGARIYKECTNASAAANCYLIRWEHPIERNNLKNYYIWLDTTVVKDSVQNVSQAQINEGLKIPYNNIGKGDSLDLTDLLSPYSGKDSGRDSLHVAIWAEYDGSDQGLVQHLYVFFGDDIRPSVVTFSDSSSTNSIWINWVRPTDQTDFYLPDSINGIIAGYNIVIREVDSNKNITDVPVAVSNSTGSLSSSNIKRNYAFMKDGRKTVLNSMPTRDSLRLAIVDGQGFDAVNNANNWTMRISNLKPEHSYNVTIIAMDTSGNSSGKEERRISTTDMVAPLVANKFWLYADSGDGLPRLDSNRLVLFWPRSVDPIFAGAQIELDSTLRINCSNCYKEIESYSLEQWSGLSWAPIAMRKEIIKPDILNNRYTLENDSMKADPEGMFISDTLRFVAPGDTIILRIRARDFSGYYSKAWIDTIIVSRGQLWQTNCPPDYMPVAKRDSSVFCMEKLQHRNGNNFEKNVLYKTAKKICEDLNATIGFENFSVGLCTEEEWNFACTNKNATHGIIEERNDSIFRLPDFLANYCNVGTGDSISANNINKRNKLCTSVDGIRDLPGNLQEWVVSITDSGEVPVLKGSSYAKFQGFEGASRADIAQCRNSFMPTRIRQKYTTDSVYLYTSGMRTDTLLIRDAFRDSTGKPAIVLDPATYKDTLLIYNIKDLDGVLLGEDYVDQKEYNRRGKEKWLDVLWQGLTYEFKEPKNVLILGTENVNAANIFLDASVGFRCCAKAL